MFSSTAIICLTFEHPITNNGLSYCPNYNPLIITRRNLCVWRSVPPLLRFFFSFSLSSGNFLSSLFYVLSLFDDFIIANLPRFVNTFFIKNPIFLCIFNLYIFFLIVLIFIHFILYFFRSEEHTSELQSLA